MNDGDIYEFDDVSFDTASLRLSKGGVPVELEPKAVDVLRLLIAHRDRLVTKEELLDAVWADTFVTPNVLTRVVAQLRKGLGDDARESRYIETVTKRGYRFIAPVTARPADVSRSAVVAPLVEDSPQPVPELAGGASEPAPVASPRSRSTTRAYLGAALVALVVVGALAAWFLRPRAATAVPAEGSAMPAVRRLLGSVTGSFIQPTLSPDGHRIAYVSDKTGRLEIYVNTIDTGGRELAVTNDGAQNDQPHWSPDGQWIAYHSRVKGGVWVVPAAGGVPRQVVEFGAQPAWSPDSQWVAFSSHEGALSAQSVLWLVRADGSERRQLTALGMPGGGHQMPAWSPDGERLVFMNFTGGLGNSLWTVSRSGTAPELLQRLNVPGNPLDSIGYPQFGPDGRAVYFMGASDGGNGRLFRLTIDPATFRPHGTPEPLLPFDASMAVGLSISSSGTAVYSLVEEDSNLWSVEWPANGQLTRLTDGRRNYRPAFSSDGRRIAYVNYEVGQGLTVWVMDAATGRTEPLLPGRNGFSPQWTAEGTVVIRNDPSSDAAFSSVDLATRRATPLAFDGRRVNEVRLSPDGTTMLFHEIGADGVLNLWTETLASGARRQLTFDREAISYPTWSPDGRWIAAEVKRGENTHVVVVPATGGPPRQLTNEPGQSWPNAWSPDGEWVAFAGQRASVWNLWAVSTRTGETRQLTRFTTADIYVRWPAWSPRGDRIVFERNQRRGAIWMSTLK